MHEILSLKNNMLFKKCDKLVYSARYHFALTANSKCPARGLQIYARSICRRVFQRRGFCRRTFIIRKSDSNVSSQVSDSSVLWSKFIFWRDQCNIIFAFLYIHVLWTLSKRFQSICAETFNIYFILFGLARAKCVFNWHILLTINHRFLDRIVCDPDVMQSTVKCSTTFIITASRSRVPN